MQMTRFRSALRLTFALVVSLSLNIAHSQVPAPTPTVDQIIQSLEKSGALDRAIARGIERYRQKQIDAAQAKQQKEEAQRAAMAKNARAVDPKNDFIYGKPDAIISIIEYSDFECPYCKQFSPVPIEVANQMPGKVNVVWRDFPLPFHEPMASKEAAAAICVGQQKGNDAFWKFNEGIFKSTLTNGQGLPKSNMRNDIFKQFYLSVHADFYKRYNIIKFFNIIPFYKILHAQIVNLYIIYCFYCLGERKG